MHKQGATGRKDPRRDDRHIQARLPGRTVWEKPSTNHRASAHKRPIVTRAVLKRLAPAVIRSNAHSGLRPSTQGMPFKRPAGTPTEFATHMRKKLCAVEQRWIGAAVELGQRGGHPTSHKEGNQRVSMVLLPSVADAPDGKPRGVRSLQQALHASILAGTYILSDEWRATAPVVDAAGLRVEGQVNHNENFRHPATGIHSNGVESEFGRVKSWLQK